MTPTNLWGTVLVMASMMIWLKGLEKAQAEPELPKPIGLFEALIASTLLYGLPIIGFVLIAS